MFARCVAGSLVAVAVTCAAVVCAAVGCTGGRTGLGMRGPDGAILGEDAGTVACGDASCSNATQYCKTVVGGPPPGIHRDTCTDLPSGCAACACISADRGCQCTATDGIHVRCDVP